MAELQDLAAADRAVLSLVVAQSKSFRDIADVLRMPPESVRLRAHHAVMHLAAPPDALSHEHREGLLDYVLGQSAPSAGIREELRLNPDARAWTMELTRTLTPLIRKPLSGVPQRAEVAPPEETVAPV